MAVCLMQKCIDKGSEINIRSAIALDHLKNFIYVEAHKETHVREVCITWFHFCWFCFFMIEIELLVTFS